MKIKPSYIVIPLITIVVAMSGGYFTESGMNWYYSELVKPELTPPGYVFSVAWTLIFILTALAAIIAWENRKKKKYIIELFTANAVLNVTWSLLFFYMKKPGLALIDLLLLAGTLVLLFPKVRSCCKTASWLILPYIVWICFAGYLNYSIILLN